jgi:hypothetical protein
MYTWKGITINSEIEFVLLAVAARPLFQMSKKLHNDILCIPPFPDIRLAMQQILLYYIFYAPSIINKGLRISDYCFSLVYIAFSCSHKYTEFT